jgi:hypothetical protein
MISRAEVVNATWRFRPVDTLIMVNRGRAWQYTLRLDQVFTPTLVFSMDSRLLCGNVLRVRQCGVCQLLSCNSGPS